jgi:hypothetical protein
MVSVEEQGMPGQEVTFTRPMATVPLYVAAQLSPPVVYRPVKATSSILTLAQAWDDGGAFVLLGAPLWDLAGFATALQDCLAQPEHVGARFVWLSNPGDTVSQWQLQTIPVQTQRGRVEVRATTHLRWRNLALRLPQGAELVRAAGRFECKPPASEPGGIRFTVTRGETATDLAIVQAPLWLPFFGQMDHASAWRCQVRLQAADLAALQVGLCVFIDQTSNNGTPAWHTVWYPVFDVQEAPLILDAQLDPNAPLDAACTHFTFPAVPTALTSYYRTTVGRPVALTPQADARLILVPQPTAADAVDQAPVYLVPEGTFQVAMPRPPGVPVSGAADRLMCGLSGVEYIAMPSAGRPVFWRFVAGQNAAVATGSSMTAGRESGLSNAATTAWVRLLADDLTYYAQPEDATLHQPERGSEFLTLLEIPTGHLPGPGQDVDEDWSFPMMPYAGVPGEVTLPQDIERQVLSPVRRALMQTLSHPQTLAASERQSGTPSPRLHGVTPQGLLATFRDQGQTWESLLLAQSPQSGRLEFSRIEGPLKAALQTNQLFLVISDPHSIATHLSQTSLTISGWTFHLAPETWEHYGTVFLAKFYTGMSLRQLVDERTVWTQAAAFNRDPETVQHRLQQHLTMPDGDAAFDTLRRVVDNPAWQGVLVLNCSVPLDGLPPQFQGLAAGIDPSRFAAHHLGIDTSPVQQTLAGALQMGASAMFALIRYEAPDGPASQESYDFTVTSLQATFANSQVTSFASTVQVTLNTLFGEPATIQAAAPEGEAASAKNIIVLHGHYASHEGHPTYVFESDVATRFALIGSVLEGVTVTRAYMTTQTPAADRPDDQLRQVNFLFQGLLHFKPPPTVLDIFSYRELAFDQLGLQMEFNLAQPASDRTFTFDTSQLTLDATGSEPAPDSLVRQFPLRLSAFLSGSADITPESLGYLPVRAPKELTGLVDPDWYGLTFTLSLGNMGALTAQEEILATLLMAWSPTGPGTGAAQTQPVALALKLPFVGGDKKELSLQGVIKLSLQAVELLYQDGSYRLRLRNIKLKLLSLAFPPSGTTDITLFGDPTGKTSSLAWYGAYAKEAE